MFGFSRRPKVAVHFQTAKEEYSVNIDNERLVGIAVDETSVTFFMPHGTLQLYKKDAIAHIESLVDNLQNIADRIKESK